MQRKDNSYKTISSLFNAGLTAGLNTAHFLWKYKKTWAVLLLVTPYAQASAVRENEENSQDICEPNFNNDLDNNRWDDATNNIFYPREVENNTTNKLRTWNDFRDHRLFTGFASSNGFYFTAVQDNAEPEEEFTNRWFLVLRNGLYAAQVDQSMAVIYRLLLGHAPDVQIIKDVRNKNDISILAMQRHYANRNNEPKYYVASRGIKNFITWAQYSAERYGNLKIIGLGELLAIAEFFGESDLHGGNFGFKVTKDSLIAYKIDNSKALSFKCLDASLDQNSINQLPACMDVPSNFAKFIEKNGILNEKHKMLKKIANTDFYIIEEILRRYITSDIIESTMWDIKFAESIGIIEQKDIARIKHQVLNMNRKAYDIDAIIHQIKHRHQILQTIFEKPNIRMKM